MMSQYQLYQGGL